MGHTTSKWIGRALRLAIYLRDGFKCCFCLCSLRGLHRNLVTLDHLIPGAGDAPRNLAASCKACNSAKRDRTYYDYLRATYPKGVAEYRIRRIHRLIEKPVGQHEVDAAAWLMRGCNGWPV